MLRQSLSIALLSLLTVALPLSASEYVIDTRDSHAFIEFRISHLGYSWLLGRFNTFEGSFDYAEQAPSESSVSVTIQTKSVDTNHAERDKHLRGKDFLDVARYPQAKFQSRRFDADASGNGQLYGDLTLHGVTHPITLKVKQIGAGMDPWGGYRRGFEATTKFKLKDYGIDYDLGPASREVYLHLYVEGIRQDDENRHIKR